MNGLEPGTHKGMEAAFQSLPMANIRLSNRLVRAATYEGMAERDGTPRAEILGDLYGRLAQGGVGAVISGFAFVSPEGRAMQVGQCGIERDARTGQWRSVLDRARRHGGDTKFFLQMAHAGRQTRREVTGLPVVGASSRRCTYFRQRVHPMTDGEVRHTIAAFGAASRRAREAGFDGIQIHAAHGYLIHQFLSPWTNRRGDEWGDRPRFLEEILAAVRRQCGDEFPLLVKLSVEDNNTPGVRIEDTIETARRMAKFGVDALEISYGTMEYALNIIRGGCPADVVLRVNPLFRNMSPPLRWLWIRFFMRSFIRKCLPFTENYNLAGGEAVRRETGMPVIAVGGVCSGAGVARALASGVDAVAMCRPFICEPAFARRLRTDPNAVAACTHCNHCTVCCDGSHQLRCYRNREEDHESG
jgi:2,4-dienoyl-CoA reductase-like NADH-dependent reductase (Old Yellow Enzyme family)